MSKDQLGSRRFATSNLRRLGACVLVAAAVLTATATASADPPAAGNGAVFVQTDNPAGNQIVAYQRNADGTLTQAGTYSTDGLGGTLNGSVVDHLASQGSLTYDARTGMLYAVNAGSNTVAAFAVSGDSLTLRQVIGSGGTFPVSIAVSGHLLYVVNALNGGAVTGFIAAPGHLVPIAGSTRALGLDPTATPQFTSTPGQLLFSPDGSQLIVTTKANGNDIDVFSVGHSGSLSSTPVTTQLPGAVPFAGTFDSQGDLIVAEAGPNAVARFTLAGDGSLTQLDSVPTGQSATCWVVGAGPYLYASNAGSSTLSIFGVGINGALSPIGTAATHPATVDAAASPGGHYLYVQTGGEGILDEFSVNPDGSLTGIATVLVPNSVGGEGIVAT